MPRTMSGSKPCLTQSAHCPSPSPSLSPRLFGASSSTLKKECGRDAEQTTAKGQVGASLAE